MAQFLKIVEAGPDREKDGVNRPVAARRSLKRVIAERISASTFMTALCRKAPEEAWFLAPQRSGRVIRLRTSGSSRPLKKLPRARWKSSSRRVVRDDADREIWFQDEARIGQKNGLVRQWARRGTSTKTTRRSALRQRLSVRRDLAQRGRRSGLGASLCRQRHDATPPRRNLEQRRQGRTRRGASRQGRVAASPASSTCPKTSHRSSCLRGPRS